MNEHSEVKIGDESRFGSADWWIYRGTGRPIHDLKLTDILPGPPPWRRFRGKPPPGPDTPPADGGEIERKLGSAFHLDERDVDPHEVDVVNAALCLRRPLLVTGRPGTGKSTLAYRISRELGLGRVLRWPITSHTTLSSGLYSYDAIGRAQAAGGRLATRNGDKEPPEESPVGEFLRLGVLGTAFLPHTLPRVLLIDELDKSEADLPNDLLSIFEDGEFPIPELERVRSREREVTVFTADPEGTATITDGRVVCHAFPIIVITSNGEREFPPAFLRRCLQLETRELNYDQLSAMAAAHLHDGDDDQRGQLIRQFLERSASSGGLPADKLLEALFISDSFTFDKNDPAWSRLVDALWRQLNTGR